MPSQGLQGFKAELFRALGHPVRIRILELLREREQSVSELQAQLGSEGSTASQQLAVLRGRQLVAARREGTSVFYRVTDPNVFDLLDAGRRIFENQLVSLQALAAGEATAGDDDA